MIGEDRIKLIEALVVTAEIYGKQLSEAGARILADDLAGIELGACLKALERCRKELRTFPTVADVLARAQALDGRPGAEEAWAMLPKSESDSVVWTEEMAAAFGACSSLIGEDDIAARMAFREVYTKRVQDARDAGRPARWTPSLGHSKEGRQVVLEEAYRLGRLDAAQVAGLLPEPGKLASAVAELAKDGIKQIKLMAIE